MCFSAQVLENYKRLQRAYGASPDWAAIKRLFWQRIHEKNVRVPKAMELAFEDPETQDEVEIKKLIDEYRLKQTRELEQELFKQKKRLGDAERTLKTKTTKKAVEDQRIASSKIEQLVKRIADVNRTELKERDSRIYPFWYSLIVVDEGTGPAIIPARYHCRPAGKPEMLDRKFDGLYNARRDSLEKFWAELFGQRHAVMQVSSFYENVALHDVEQRKLNPGEEPENVVLQFNPAPPMDMTIACLWSRWDANLVSFAAITDEPPPEIAAAGHDRVIVSLRREYIDAWLHPRGRDRGEFYKMFDDRERPFFEHRKAA
jgi:putative SOS response-associated peptidase YedK